MTTIVTRLYDTQARAKSVVAALKKEGFPDDMVGMIAGGKSKKADLVDKIRGARIGEAAAGKYANAVMRGANLVVVHAPFSPIGAAERAIEIADAHSPMDSGVENENVYIREDARASSILKDHPRFFSGDIKPGSLARKRTASSAFGLGTLMSGLNTQFTIYKNHRFWTLPPRITKGGHIFPFPIYKNHRYWTLPPRVTQK